LHCGGDNAAAHRVYHCTGEFGRFGEHRDALSFKTRAYLYSKSKKITVVISYPTINADLAQALRAKDISAV